MYSKIDGTVVEGGVSGIDWHPDFQPSATARRRYGITKEELRLKHPTASIQKWKMLYQIFDAPDVREGYQ